MSTDADLRALGVPLGPRIKILKTMDSRRAAMASMQEAVSDEPETHAFWWLMSSSFLLLASTVIVLLTDDSSFVSGWPYRQCFTSSALSWCNKNGLFVKLR